MEPSEMLKLIHSGRRYGQIYRYYCNSTKLVEYSIKKIVISF